MGLVRANALDLFEDTVRQVETVAFPIAWQVLRAGLDRAVVTDEPRASDADDGCKLKAILLGQHNMLLQHLNETPHGPVSVRLLIVMAPELRGVDRCLGEVLGLLELKLDDAGA